MFIRTLKLPEWPSDLAISNHSLGDNCTEEEAQEQIKLLAIELNSK